jgi:chromosome segregation ATPase
MKDSITDLLDDLSVRLDCDVLDADHVERELSEKFSSIPIHTSKVADEIKQIASSKEALSFVTDLSAFLNTARQRAMEAQKLKDAIVEMLEQIAEMQHEFSYLSACQSSLAANVNHAMFDLETAQSEYDENQLKLGILERRMDTGRRETISLRRKLSELTMNQEEVF